MDNSRIDNLIPDFPDMDFLRGDAPDDSTDAEADFLIPPDEPGLREDLDLDRRVDALLAELGSAADIFSGLSEPSVSDVEAPCDAAEPSVFADKDAVPPAEEPPEAAVTVSEESAEADEAFFEDDGETPFEPDEADNPILSIHSGEEELPELESAFIRRVAAREAHKSRSRRAEAEPLPADETPETADSALPDDIDEDIEAELDAFFDDKEKKASLTDRLKAPLIRFLAIRKMREKLREQEAASWPQPVDIRQTTELKAVKASRFYAAMHRSLRLRLFASLFLTLVSLWIGFGLPMAGMLADSTAVQAGVSLVFLLAAMVCALDIISVGIRQLFSFQASLEALCAFSCLFSIADCVLVMTGLTAAVPYCAPACLSICAALWANDCKCLAACSNLQYTEKDVSSVLTVERESEDAQPTLIRSEREEPGIVRRSEEADGAQIAYSFAAPALFVLSLALGAVSTIGSDWHLLIHHISAYLTVCAGAAGFLCFAVPYLIAAVRLRRINASLAGWTGCADIGRCPRMIVTDTDMFPKGTIHLASATKKDGEDAEKLLSYLVSLLTASGSSVTDAFDDLMAQCKHPIHPVEDFQCHDGGGLSAYIQSEYVLAGSPGFLNLMGIRLPQELNTHNAICLAVSNEIVGVFQMQYKPVKGVRYALDLLMSGRTQPVFAIRDFNITPLMIQELFRIPAINFEFPSFRERYRLSSLSASKDTPPAAVLHRSGIRCAVETAEIGRRLYLSCIIGTAASIFSAILGMFFVFTMLRSGGAASVSCGKLLIYALLWLLPVFGTAYWTAR